MFSGDSDWSPDEGADERPRVQCSACDAALQSPGRDAVSFLLLDQLTIPVVGCDTHLEQFRSACGLTTAASPDLLDYLPAGGVQCPGCRNERYASERSLVPVDGGALAVLACPRHQSAVLERYRSGRQTQRRLTATLDTA